MSIHGGKGTLYFLPFRIQIHSYSPYMTSWLSLSGKSWGLFDVNAVRLYRNEIAHTHNAVNDLFFLNNLEVVTPTGCCHFVVGIILTLVNGVLQLILLRSDSWVWVVNWVQYTMEIVWMFFSGLDLRQHWYVLWSDLLVSFCVCLFHNFISSWFPFVNMVRTKKFIITSKSTKTGHRCSLVVTLLWILCAGNYHSISCVIVPAMYIM